MQALLETKSIQLITFRPLRGIGKVAKEKCFEGGISLKFACLDAREGERRSINSEAQLKLQFPKISMSIVLKILTIRAFTKEIIQKVRLSWRGGRGGLKKWTKTNRGGGQAYLYVRPVKKISCFFKSQTKFFLISCLVVAKSFSVLSLVQPLKVYFY